MINWQPYRLSLFVARHVQSRCQLCRYRLATVIDDVAVTDVDNLDAYDDSIFGGLNRLVNRGILCLLSILVILILVFFPLRA